MGTFLDFFCRCHMQSLRNLMLLSLIIASAAFSPDLTVGTGAEEGELGGLWCSVKCTAASIGTTGACAGCIATAGLACAACPGALVGAIDTCGDCPDTFCYLPQIAPLAGFSCAIDGLHFLCEFCGWD